MLFIIKLLDSKSVVQDPHLQSVTALTDFLLKKGIFTPIHRKSSLTFTV